MTFEVKADEGVGGQAIGRGKMVFCGLVWSDEGEFAEGKELGRVVLFGTEVNQ